MMSRLSSRLLIAPVLALLSFTLACGNNSPTVPDGFDIPALVITDTQLGTGAEATVGRAVTVHYAGWLYSPTAAGNKGGLFDTSAGRSPLPFTVGAGGVIPGFDQGVRGMKVGGKRTVQIPSSMAYGRSGSGSIPPNSAIVFDIELITVQ